MRITITLLDELVVRRTTASSGCVVSEVSEYVEASEASDRLDSVGSKCQPYSW